MATEERFASFFSRVDFEREVLQLTNIHFGVENPLHGLTPAAREIWAEKQGHLVSYKFTVDNIGKEIVILQKPLLVRAQIG